MPANFLDLSDFDPVSKVYHNKTVLSIGLITLYSKIYDVPLAEKTNHEMCS